MSRHLPPEPVASAASDAPPRDVLARRRFVRGVFAAPAVMTVCSGSAYAASSLTCMRRIQTAPDPMGVDVVLPVNASETPAYLRVSVYRSTAQNDTILYVSKSQLSMAGNPPYAQNLAAFDYIALDPSDGSLTPNGRPAAEIDVNNVAGYVIVRFDAHGVVVDTGLTGGDGAVTSMLCWDSVSPA